MIDCGFSAVNLVCFLVPFLILGQYISRFCLEYSLFFFPGWRIVFTYIFSWFQGAGALLRFEFFSSLSPLSLISFIISICMFLMVFWVWLLSVWIHNGVRFLSCLSFVSFINWRSYYWGRDYPNLWDYAGFFVVIHSN